MTRPSGEGVFTPVVARRGRQPWPVLLVYLGTMAVLLLGLLRSPFSYADPRFVVGYLGTELQVAAVLLVCTVLFFKPSGIGWRVPRGGDAALIAPALLMLGLNAAAWACARCTSTAAADSAAVPALHILRTTLLVGLTEEWTYRGVLLATLCTWLGLRRGALVSLLLFGLLHALNLAGGQAPWQVGVQVVMAMVTGATLLLLALGTRSLLVAMLVHGLYDFLVIDRARMVPTDLSSQLSLVALAAGPLLGLYGLWRIARLPDDRVSPYLRPGPG